MRPGFAQSVFQVGGNAGSALGPLAAAFVVLKRGQTSIEWFAIVALTGMALLWRCRPLVCRRSPAPPAPHPARPAPRRGPPPAATSRHGMVLVILLMSKFVYSVSLSSYYTFYLIERFALTKASRNLCLFIFLAAVAAGTIIGGPIGDRIGRRRVILWSILGILPLTMLPCPGCRWCPASSPPRWPG
jgi:FSR family fosmidomycin resistance protein-like MFS transporter